MKTPKMVKNSQKIEKILKIRKKSQKITFSHIFHSGDVWEAF